MKSGDPIGMSFIGGSKSVRNVPVRGGREVFERVVDALRWRRKSAEGEAMHDLAVLDRTRSARSPAMRGAAPSSSC